MAERKRVIVWRVTQECNMNCLFCSYSNQIQRKRDIAKNEDILRVAKLLGEYKKNSGREVLISWIGGEPFLWKEIINFSRILKNEAGIEISTTTNGLLINSDKIQEEIVDYFSEITISIDGFKECNDRVRQHSGHFEKVIKNIENIVLKKSEKNSKIVIKVNTILMRENIAQFEEFCQRLVEAGVNEVTYNQLGGYDRPEFYPENRLLKEQVNSFFEKLTEIKENFLKKGLKIYGGENYEKRIKHSTENKAISLEECNPGSWFWFINENGFISPCSYTTYEYMESINNIKKTEDIDKIEESFRKMRKENKSKWCLDCHCTQMYDKFE